MGGDGTVLYASWLFQRIVPPVLSFALGSLGFLTKFDYSNFRNTLTTAFRDGVTVSLRLRFEATVMRAQKGEEGRKGDLVEELIGEESDDYRTHKPDGTYQILNDVVVDRGPNPSRPSSNFWRDQSTNRHQQCLQSRYSGTMSILRPCKPTGSALPPLPDRRPTTWPQEAHCVIPRTQSYYSRLFAPTRYLFGRSSFPTPWS